MATTEKETEGASGADTGQAASDGKARRRASEAYEAARQRTATLYGSARDGAANAYESTRKGAARAGQRTAEEINANPLAALVGGLALGAIVAGLLPRTERETRSMGALGGRINDKAREAARAARDTGRDKLDELGFNRDNLGQKISELASSASAAIRDASGDGRGRKEG